MIKGISDYLINLIKIDIKDDITKQLMDRFDEEIPPFEDTADPMRPSLFRDEFQTFIESTIENSVVIDEDSISFGVGDDKKLGFSEELDKNTTDGIKIIGTILQGISGEYVLVTQDLAEKIFHQSGEDLGRTGEAYLMQKTKYDEGVEVRGWPAQPTWRFSNFSGIPDFFDKIQLDMAKYLSKLGAD